MSLKIDIWDNAGFSNFLGENCIRHAEADYLSMRLLIFFWPSLVYNNIAHLGAECLEKIMKAFLFFNGVSSQEIKNYNHNLNEIRERCADFNSFFSDAQLKEFSQNYSDGRWNEVLRYWMQRNTKGYWLEIFKIMKLVDKFFLGSLPLLKTGSYLHSATLNISTIFSTKSHFKIWFTHISEQEIENIKNALSKENEYLKDLIKIVDDFFEKIGS